MVYIDILVKSYSYRYINPGQSAVIDSVTKGIKNAAENPENKYWVNSAEEVSVDEGLDKETLHKCERCDFIGKTEGGLKTHMTTKHKTVSLKGYRKINWCR